jgi:transposase
MGCVRFTMSPADRQEVAGQLKTAQHLGNLRQGTYLLAILAVLDGQSCVQVAGVFRVHEQTIATWGGAFCGYGLKGAPRQKPTGRPPTLTPTPHAALATLLDEGPVKAGCSGACWRAPLIPPMIVDRFGVFSHVFDSAQVLKHLGLSFQTAACVSAHLDEANRHAWRPTTWPQILRRAQARKALLLCGDEASVPQWGTRTSTWARRGQQPKVRPCGTRKG